MKPVYRIARTVIYPFFKWIFPVKFVGFEETQKKGGYILCANHTSMTDPCYMAVIMKRQIYFMAKAELFKVPVVKDIAKGAGAFAVDRGSGDMSAIEHAENLIKRGHILGIFPEGTRHKTGAPHKAKSGIAYIAMHTKADILPISVYREGKFNIFRKTTVRCGEVIPFGKLYDETLSDRANIKNIANRVTEEITKLWEKKHEY